MGNIQGWIVHPGWNFLTEKSRVKSVSLDFLPLALTLTQIEEEIFGFTPGTLK